MVALRIEQFGGMIPLQDDHLLPQMNAAYSENANLASGAITCYSALKPIYTVVDPGTRAVFRIPKASPSVDNIADSDWIEFLNEDVWVVRNPTPSIGHGGLFYWGDGVNPPGYTSAERVRAANPPLVLGIPLPAIAPGVVVVGGAPPVETRSYIYTWASQFGEEGQPSPATLVTGNADGSWDITLTAPTVPNTAGRVLETTRIYRTVTSTQGVADFFFVAEIPITTLLYHDVTPSLTVALNDTLRSEDWGPPPIDLKGLVNMPNGMIAGFRENEIWFCEPYRPHAWPAQYVLGVESNVVGLGVQQQSLIICTTGWTYIATGISPSGMALTRVTTLEPCTSMTSIVSSPLGVLYTSSNGLIVCNAGVEINGTAELVRKDEWPKLLYLPNLHAAYINRSYVAFSVPSDGVFQADAFQVGEVPENPADPAAFQSRDFSGTTSGAVISLQDPRLAFQVLVSDKPVQNIWQDVWTGEMLVLRAGVVEHFDLRLNYPRLGYVWRSKIFQTPYRENWAAAKVFFQQPAGPPPDRPTYFRLYVDGRKVFERKLKKSGEQFRLPSGFKYDQMQFELDGQLVVNNVQIATSARELRSV